MLRQSAELRCLTIGKLEESLGDRFSNEGEGLVRRLGNVKDPGALEGAPCFSALSCATVDEVSD